METKTFGRGPRKAEGQDQGRGPRKAEGQDQGRSGRRRRPLGKYRWAVYPDYWKDSWGRRPLLGHVIADDEFYAEREAYNRGLLPVNFTFRPHVVNVGVVEQN